jgi:NTE family protein
VQRRLHVETGAPLDNEKLVRQLKELYALDYFGIIRDDLVVDGGKGTLTVTTPRKPYSRNSLQFGVSLESDVQTAATYSVTVRHMLVAANRRGGEWVNVLQLGNHIVMSSQFYQPLDWSMRWFAAPAISYGRGNQKLWADGQPVAEYGVRNRDAQLEMGRVFRNWGEAKIGVFRGYETGFPDIGVSVFPTYETNDGGLSFTLRADTQNTVAFPTQGTLGWVRVERSIEGFGADATGTWVEVSASKSMTWGRNTFSLGAEGSTTNGSPLTLQNAATLGGFLKLSGLGTQELFGEEGGVARVVYYRDLVWLKLGALSNRVVAGMSFEAGNVYEKDETITWDSLRWGGAIFVGADTLIGPAYIGWGWTEPNRSRLYFVFGQRF